MPRLIHPTGGAIHLLRKPAWRARRLLGPLPQFGMMAATGGGALAEAGVTELKHTGYEIFIMALTVLSIVNLILLTILDSSTMTTVVLAVNAVLSLVLFLDFLYRLATRNPGARTSSATTDGRTCWRVCRLPS